MGIDEVIASENANGEVLWALTDNLGSVRVLLDNDGNVVNNITYDAFGNVTVETDGGVDFRFNYTGIDGCLLFNVLTLSHHLGVV